MITDGEKHHLNSLHLEKKKYSGGYWSSQSFRLVLRCLWFCYIPTLWKTFCYGNIPNGLTPSLLNNERKRKEKEKKETKSRIKCVCYLEEITINGEKSYCRITALWKYCHCETGNAMLTQLLGSWFLEVSEFSFIMII